MSHMQRTSIAQFETRTNEQKTANAETMNDQTILRFECVYGVDAGCPASLMLDAGCDVIFRQLRHLTRDIPPAHVFDTGYDIMSCQVISQFRSGHIAQLRYLIRDMTSYPASSNI